MNTQLPEIGSKVVVHDHFAHGGATTVRGVSTQDPRLVIVYPVSGLVMDFNHPVRFSEYPRSGCWSWPEPDDKHEHAIPPRSKVLLVPPQR